MTEHSFPRPEHDHKRCVVRLLRHAEQLCIEAGVRLTDQRRAILEIIGSSHKATGAYDVLETMAEQGQRSAPITVYRGLDFLMSVGLVHRISSLNAFIACHHNHGPNPVQLLICKACGAVGELQETAVTHAIKNAAGKAGFTMEEPVVEVSGICAHCYAA
jgi:Fur family transcriptional regulator, zinc uptake regulator